MESQEASSGQEGPTRGGPQPPVWKNQTYSMWVREVEVWEMACGHQVSKRAFILALAQTGGVKREKAVKWVSQNPNAGVERGASMLLEELKTLSSGEATKGVDNLAQVIGARRQQGESVGGYVDRFLMMVSDLEETGEGNSLQESEAGRLALCVMMLKGSGLDSTRRQILSASDAMKDVAHLGRELKRGEELAKACEIRESVYKTGTQDGPDLSKMITEQVASVLAAWKGAGKGGGGWQRQQQQGGKGGKGGKSGRRCWRCDRTSHVQRDCYATHKADGTKIESKPNKDKGKGPKGFKMVEDWDEADSFPVMLVTLRVADVPAEKKQTNRQPCDGRTWVVDSGASVHISSQVENAHNVRDRVTMLTVANGESLRADKIGDFWLETKSLNGTKGGRFLLKDVILCQGCPYNILSVNSATRKGAAFEFRQDGGAIKMNTGAKLEFLRVNEEGGQYVVNATPVKGENSPRSGEEKRRETASQ